jgi:YbbR domain-containing protein
MAWRPFRNIGLKIAALGLGVLLWVTISGQQVERSVLVQLQFRNIPASLELTGDTPRTVDVRVRGAAGLISALEPYQVVATVDLTDTRAGLRIFPLTNEQISVPLGVDVKSVDPPTISLTLEKSAIAQVEVRPTIDGDPAAGYEMGEVTVQPSRVEVIGPESHLQDRPAAVTERISIEGATAAVNETVSLGLTDPAVRLRQTQSARVTIRIVPAPVVRLPGLPVDIRRASPGRRVSAEPAAVTLSVQGAASILKSLGERQLQPYVDVSGLRPGRHTVAVRVDGPDGLVISAITPASIVVRIQ